MDFKSKLLNDAVEEMSSLPGIGKRTALRLVLHLLNQNKEEVSKFSNAFINLREQINFCKQCYNISDTEVCHICQNQERDHTLICVVQDIRDILAIESTQQFKGYYHVLGGIISPMDGIGPDDLNIEELVKRAENEKVKEVILALSATMEGDTTNFYLFRKLSHTGVKVSVIARGIGIGNELEYTDEITLGRSILHRAPFESSLTK